DVRFDQYDVPLPYIVCDSANRADRHPEHRIILFTARYSKHACARGRLHSKIMQADRRRFGFSLFTGWITKRPAENTRAANQRSSGASFDQKFSTRRPLMRTAHTWRFRIREPDFGFEFLFFAHADTFFNACFNLSIHLTASSCDFANRIP